jgi:hypothetical protein
LKNNSRIKKIRDLYRGINEFKKGYQPITNTINDEKGDLVTESHSILARWRNHFTQPSMNMGLVMLGRQKHTQQDH